MISRIESFPRSRVALYDDEDRAHTYGDLSILARRAHGWLLRRGLAPGDRVATLAYGTPEHVALFLACQRAGVTLVPLNWRLSKPELDAILSDCAPRAILLDDAANNLSLGSDPRLKLSAEIGRSCQVSWTGDEPGPEAIPLILYTSGTTGKPKGAMLSNRMLAANVLQTNSAWELAETDSTVTAAPFFHTGGWNVLTLPLLCAGGNVTLLKRFDAARVARLAAAGRASVLFGVPTMFEALLAEGLTGPRFVISGGAPCPEPLIRAYLERGVAFRQGFGMTEAGPNCFVFPAGSELSKLGSVGRPMPGTEMRLADDGELFIRGPHLFSGYLGRPEETQAALLDGWVRTGDLAARDADGCFRILGRKKDMYISGGENVYPGEVEIALAEHPAVQDASVVGVPDAKWGEAGVAFVVPRPERPVDPAELMSFLDGRLARFKRPREIRVLDALPRNAMGKVQKPALRALLS
ncbi:MAG: AMP-binding protein [Elusimicrobia bacterium]|nr:AMP-binding protein [Elusimicrobiota bacterium]